MIELLFWLVGIYAAGAVVFGALAALTLRYSGIGVEGVLKSAFGWPVGVYFYIQGLF